MLLTLCFCIDYIYKRYSRKKFDCYFQWLAFKPVLSLHDRYIKNSNRNCYTVAHIFYPRVLKLSNKIPCYVGFLCVTCYSYKRKYVVRTLSFVASYILTIHYFYYNIILRFYCYYRYVFYYAIYSLHIT